MFASNYEAGSDGGGVLPQGVAFLCNGAVRCRPHGSPTLIEPGLVEYWLDQCRKVRVTTGPNHPSAEVYTPDGLEPPQSPQIHVVVEYTNEYDVPMVFHVLFMRGRPPFVYSVPANGMETPCPIVGSENCILYPDGMRRPMRSTDLFEILYKDIKNGNFAFLRRWVQVLVKGSSLDGVINREIEELGVETPELVIGGAVIPMLRDCGC